MKGPGGRLKFDVRRVWECPACHHRARTGGDVVNRACDCQADADPPRQVWMRLVEETPVRPEPPTAS
ncbi:MAG TPA: hypothetical protein VFA26_23535 [Gemmataceae bacterium]|nr:hypothetical protein [Gemmataceae bacterium]